MTKIEFKRISRDAPDFDVIVDGERRGTFKWHYRSRRCQCYELYDARECYTPFRAEDRDNFQSTVEKALKAGAIPSWRGYDASA